MRFGQKIRQLQNVTRPRRAKKLLSITAFPRCLARANGRFFRRCRKDWSRGMVERYAVLRSEHIPKFCQSDLDLLPRRKCPRNPARRGPDDRHANLACTDSDRA